MNQTVLVTGASGGIGGAAARLLAESGCRVCLQAFRHADQAAQLAQALGSEGYQAISCQADLREECQVQEMHRVIRDSFGEPDAVVHAAGTALPNRLLQEVSIPEWEELFDVNVKGMFLATREFLPAMIRRGHGSIVTISSIWGVSGGACEVPYSATKGAVIGFTKALAKEVGPSGIRVNCIAPGFIQTEMNRHVSDEDAESFREELPLERLGTPQDVAKAVRFLVSPDSGYMTGQVLCVDGGYCI